MSQAVIQLLLITTFIVLPILALLLVRFQRNRIKNWRVSAKTLLGGSLIGIPIVFLLYNARGYTVQDTWDFLMWYGGGFLYHSVILYLWIFLFKRLLPEATDGDVSGKFGEVPK